MKDQIFHAPPDDAGGAGTELKEDPSAPAGSALADIGGAVEGDRPVDFSKIGGSPRPSTPAPDTETLEEGEKVTTGQPEPTATPKKEEAKATEPTKTEKKVEEPKKEVVKTQKTEVKANEDLPSDEKLPSIEEIEAMHTKAGAPEAVVKHFGGLKAVTKRYAQLYKESQAQLETEKARKGGLDEDTAKELEELRASRMIFEEETSPAVQEKITARFKEVDGALFGLLKSPSLGLNDEGEKLVRNALDNYTHESAKWLKEKILDKIQDPITLARVQNGIVARLNALDDQHKELSKLRENKETWLKGRAEEQKKEAEAWADKARSKANDLATKHEWMQKKTIPEGATKEARAAAERHNAALDEKTKEFQQLIADVYERNPEKLVETVFNNFHAGHLEGRIKEIQTERDELQKRVDELEALVGDARDAGRQKTATGGGDPPTNELEKGLAGGDAASAIARYKWKGA